MYETKNRPVVARIENSILSDNLAPMTKDAENSVNTIKGGHIMRTFSNYSEKKARHYAYTYNCDINSPKELPKSVNEVINMSDSDIMRYSKILPFNYGSYQKYLTAKYILARCQKIYATLEVRRKFEHKFENACSHPVRYYRVFDRTRVREREAWEAPNTERVFAGIELSDNYSTLEELINQLYEEDGNILKIEVFVRGLVKKVAEQNYFHDGSDICADIVAGGYKKNDIYQDMVQIVGLQLLAVVNDNVNYDGIDLNFRHPLDYRPFDYYIWVEDGKLRTHWELYSACCRAIRKICGKYRNPRFEVEVLSKNADADYEESDKEGIIALEDYQQKLESLEVEQLQDYMPEIQKFLAFVREQTDNSEELFEMLELRADGLKASEIKDLLGITEGQYRQRCNKVKKLRNMFFHSTECDEFYTQYKSYDRIMRTNGR